MRKTKFQNKLTLDENFEIREFDWTAKQQQLIEILQSRDTRCCLIVGPAGTSKTLTAMYVGLNLLKTHRVEEILYIRSVVESSPSRLGFLPGDIEEKFSAYAAPLEEKLEELLPEVEDRNYLRREGLVRPIPNNYLRGRNFIKKLVIIDECQNMSHEELVTAITRIGENGRIWLMGDPRQSDLRDERSGFSRFVNTFDDEESRDHGIHAFRFGTEDIVRSEFCAFVVKKLGVY